MFKKIQFHGLLSFILLFVLLFLLPAILGVIFIESMDDWVFAGRLGFSLGSFLTHVIFSFVFIKGARVEIKIIYGLLASLLSILFFFIAGINDWVLHFDTEYLGLILTNTIFGMIIWILIGVRNYLLRL